MMMTESTTKKNVDLGEKKVVSRRPYLVGNQNKDELVQIRITADEKLKLQEVAQRKQISLSRLIMELLSVAYF